ncbi:uncharacterized protein KQ657_003006 [Scheffersomyces spartinae]|uniref:LicD/FKTN/FKRP nucleotidyltransferase domain-containing protein n=1 Tax=Scheffersomyces spartinae TaxID=45513 RepID=A0A9P7V5N3_9ASCO|nr:uncharacterized protein KQ657_003006 [Scheffersomyces spartinae]KAG7191611.1 hypothetical protein KQ657_003006 [Scheffersomyces spartinae]
MASEHYVEADYEELAKHLLDDESGLVSFEGMDDFYTNNNRLTTSKWFELKVQSLLQLKIRTDLDDNLWSLQTYPLADTRIEIPEYYFEPERRYSRPPIQPFDPRFTLGIYIHHIQQQLDRDPHGIVKLPFHWYDWLDMSVLNKYLLSIPGERPDCSMFDSRVAEEEHERKKYKKDHNGKDEWDKSKHRYSAKNTWEFCVDSRNGSLIDDGFNEFKLPFGITRQTGKATEPLRQILGKAHLFSHGLIPNRIFFMTKTGYYSVTIEGKKKLLESGMVDDYLRYNEGYIDTLEGFQKLLKLHPPKEDEVLNNYTLTIPPERFEFNTKEIIHDLDHKYLKTKDEHDYALALHWGTSFGTSPPKHFNEASMVHTTLGDHYDWRFFTAIRYHDPEQTLNLHRLIRVWLSFTRKIGVATWIAHGSLLSWYWNGMAFPWDNDIDVQMPIMDLHKLSLHFNNSIVVEDLEEGYGRYYLDCGAFIGLRVQGNSNNNIDARFIDVDTGLYIDITGLAVSDTKRPERYNKMPLPDTWTDEDKNNNYKVNKQLQLYNCRNNHFSSLDDISPMIKTYVEGEVAYIPRNYTSMLSQEYKHGMDKTIYSHFIYIPSLRMWIPERDIKKYLASPKLWVKFYSQNKDYVSGNTNHTEYDQLVESFQKLKVDERVREEDLDKIEDLTAKNYLEFIHEEDLFLRFFSLRKFTRFHDIEMAKLEKNNSAYELYGDKLSYAFAPILHEPTQYQHRKEYTRFNEEVERYGQLVEEYKYNSKYAVSGPTQRVSTPQDKKAEEEKKKAEEEKKKAEEEKKKAEEEKKKAEEEKKKAEEEKKKAEEERKAEEEKKADAEHKAEEQLKAQEDRKAEEQRKVDE